MPSSKRFSGQLPCTSRRRFLRALSGTAAAGTFASYARAESSGESFPWLVGAAVAEIPTPLEVGLLMSSGRELWEPFEGVRMPICARTVVVERERQRIAIVALDLLGLAGEAVRGMARFKRQVAEAADSLVAPDALILCSTHTHTSPESAALTDLFLTPAFRSWADGLALTIGKTVRQAVKALQPCRLMTGSQHTSGLAVNRRIRTTKGIRSIRQPIPPEELIGPEGPMDDAVRVATFMNGDEKPVAILVNFAAHPVVEMCIKQVSPDYPGELCLEVERRHPGAVPLFLQGATGNTNPPQVSAGAEESRHYGRQLAETVDAALEKSVPATGGQLALQRRSVQLPLRDDGRQSEKQQLDTQIAAIRLGDTAIVFLPGEPFIELAFAIRETSPFPFTAVVGYSEDYIGYIPTDRAFENGGYETKPGRWSRLGPGSEETVCRETAHLLNALR